jgi:hypothetical protein
MPPARLKPNYSDNAVQFLHGGPEYVRRFLQADMQPGRSAFLTTGNDKGWLFHSKAPSFFGGHSPLAGRYS